jgi:6-phosphofructokinase 1
MLLLLLLLLLLLECVTSIPTTSNDRIYCKVLAHNAVHAAFAGYTGITVGLVNTHYVYLPIPVIIEAPRRKVGLYLG